MDISDAFQAENLIPMTDEEMTELNTWLVEVMTDQDPDREATYTEDQMVAFASLAFTAGRAYQDDLNDPEPGIELNLPPHIARLFIEFLAERASL